MIGSRRSSAADWRIDWSARMLVVMCVLNLNGVGTMMFGVGEALSYLMLATACALVIMTGRYAWTPPFMLLMAAIVSYLILGTVFHDPSLSIDPPSRYYRAYVGSILLLWGLTGYVASLPPGPRLMGFLVFARNVFLIAAASVWASPVLYQYYVDLPFSSQQRMGGFFGNPNEAAMVACLAVAITLAIPFRQRTLQLAMLGMASIAVFLTFSKTGMSVLVLILTWHFLRAARGIGLVMVLLAGLAAVIVIQDARGLLEYVTELPALELDAYQKSRILAVADILGGQLDDQTTTGRTYLWGLSLGRAWDSFPFGSGLGSAHFFIGGVLQLDNWLGVHNTFLMMWDEGGALPGALLAVAIVMTLVASLRYARGNMELVCLVILLIDMMATHTAVSTRYHNIMLAIILGCLANTYRQRSLNFAYQGAAAPTRLNGNYVAASDMKPMLHPRQLDRRAAGRTVRR